jgi:hypothetical protein
MQLIEIAYIVAAIVSISAGAPQIRRLFIAKASDELSLPTWCIWLGTQLVTLMYVISIANILMIIVAMAWISFYVAMVSLIIRYRRRPVAIEPLVVEEQPQEA